MGDEEALGRRILRLVVKRGYLGASRDDFFGAIKGVSYKELEGEIMELEKEGYITLAWIGDTNFIATTTEKGKESIG